MKWLTTILFAVMIVLFVSCKKEELPANENFIPVNKCRSYTIESKTLTLCLDSVTQDSRCPVAAVCFWQGIAVARFGLKIQNTDHTITLATFNFPTYYKDTTISGFRFELMNLTPQKELAKPFDYKDYVAEVKITKL